ncbi:uncharacterized protein LOC122030157 [Zingiber officinale]|uniref:uncharacterized protein LOC122030157 n=1 Tax=Zingiber officinale TaxID=94328 RepID=UPI001C4C6654|nr:uncharacterized protein LOC122030157 [Zingiber officinale]
MGNCQAADVAATVVIQHRDGRLEKSYWSLPATQVMAANPGHYVAAMITSNVCRPSPSTSHHQRRKPVTYLKLLPPDDTLLIGHVYRLVSFEEVLREFASKRHVRLSRLLAKQEEKASSSTVKGEDGYRACTTDPDSTVSAVRHAWVHSQQPEEHQVEAEVDKELEELVRDMMTRSNMSSSGAARHGQWKPALESIAEVGELTS